MQRNKVLTILLSLIIAIGLWVYVVSTVTPDDSQWVYRIPVTFTNEDGLFSDRKRPGRHSQPAVQRKAPGSSEAEQHQRHRDCGFEPGHRSGGLETSLYGGAAGDCFQQRH